MKIASIRLLPARCGWRHIVAAAFAIATAGPALAALVEEQHDVPIAVVDGYGKSIAQPIKVTVFFDDATPKPRPVLVINHGRAADGAGRAALGRARYSDASRWFARLGFAVIVPTRLGYGVSGGEDVEDSGACSAKNYLPGYAAAAEETIAALRFMHQRADTLKDRDIVVGQSYGGATSIAVAALNPSGTVATINFAGGGGGDPKERARSPCSPARLERMFAKYGETARVPTLWIYSVNDMYFGPDLPQQWFKAFQTAGGAGRFVQVPPYGDDGHATFVRAPAVWQPIVAEFLRAQGFDIKE